MKLLLIVLLIFAIMAIACSVSNQIKDRHNFFENLHNFLEQLKIDVSFKQTKIKDFLCKQNAGKQFQQFVDAYMLFLQTGNLDLGSLKFLEDEDKEILTEIVKSTGNYNSTNEINQLESFIARVETKQKKATDDKTKLCPVIVKLSLLFSIATAIMLV